MWTFLENKLTSYCCYHERRFTHLGHAQTMDTDGGHAKHRYKERGHKCYVGVFHIGWSPRNCRCKGIRSTYARMSVPTKKRNLCLFFACILAWLSCTPPPALIATHTPTGFDSSCKARYTLVQHRARSSEEYYEPYEHFAHLLCTHKLHCTWSVVYPQLGVSRAILGDASGRAHTHTV